jgi:hypothetical protein
MNASACDLAIPEGGLGGYATGSMSVIADFVSLRSIRNCHRNNR